jgi:hypothetical protein
MMPEWKFNIDVPVNGKVGKASVTVVDADTGKVKTTDRVSVDSMEDRRRCAKRLAKYLDKPEVDIAQKLENAWTETVGELKTHRAEQEAKSAQATEKIAVEVLDVSPDTIRRPLCLAAGRAYAVAWLHVRRTVTQTVDPVTGLVQTYDPPRICTGMALVVIRDDGQLFADEAIGLDGILPIAELGLDVRLPFQPEPARCWSGAGVKRFLKGERPDAVSVFNRVMAVVDQFMDFGSSLAPQHQMCELTACYVLASYLLDAFNVAGYLWPNGDRGCGKTNYLVVVCEMAYLGQVILAGGSYASLRDLADYGATLAFDDAEGVMDVKRADPDKRALLLAGNRRGATVTVKELAADKTWVTRHISTFCPRMFSAIKLPDEVLGSRSIIVPLIRSGDVGRAKAQPLDHATWPHNRRQLIDDLWALGLTSLSALREHDIQAAQKATLSGRDLEPWRSMLAVAHWLSEDHGYIGLFERMQELSTNYQTERGELEARDPVRVLVKALFALLQGRDSMDFTPKELADAMNKVAVEDGLADENAPEEKRFTSARKVGWLLKRQRFEKGQRGNRAKNWSIARAKLEALALAYGIQETAQSAGF